MLSAISIIVTIIIIVPYSFIWLLLLYYYYSYYHHYYIYVISLSAPHLLEMLKPRQGSAARGFNAGHEITLERALKSAIEAIHGYNGGRINITMVIKPLRTGTAPPSLSQTR